MRNIPLALWRLNWSQWVYALVNAVVGGTATMLAAVVTISDSLSHGWGDIAKLAGAAAFINLVLYLRQSPVPPVITDAPSVQE